MKPKTPIRVRQEIRVTPYIQSMKVLTGGIGNYLIFQSKSRGSRGQGSHSQFSQPSVLKEVVLLRSFPNHRKSQQEHLEGPQLFQSVALKGVVLKNAP